MCHLQELYKKYKDQGLIILGFNEIDNRQIGLDFLRDNSATFPNVLDSSDAARRIKRDGYGTSAVPTNYVIDRQGNVVDAYVPSNDQSSYKRAVEILEKLGLKREDP